jgi:hypothetical protein
MPRDHGSVEVDQADAISRGIRQIRDVIDDGIGDVSASRQPSSRRKLTA